MQITYHPSNPIETMMPDAFRKIEQSLPATGMQALRATLEGLLAQEARGENVGKRVLEVCKELDC
jgi:hypothetical protein